MICKFWWGHKKGKAQIHWLSRDRLCIPKKFGGIDFRSLSEFNMALIAKQVWRVIREPNSLLARVLKWKYFRHSCFLEIEVESNVSFAWRSIQWGQELVRLSLLWRVGDGS